MVKKLIKHEFVYYFRTLGLFLPIVLVVAAVARVFRLFDDSNVVTRIAIFSSSAILLVSCAAVLILSTVVCIVRFYKNMYSAEGYLTFTLPVTNEEHIFVKLLAAMACEAVCFLTVAVAGSIALLGEDLKTLISGIGYAIDQSVAFFGTGNMIGFTIEGILLILLAAASNMLLYYACITVGQTAKKNRILMAVGAYFIYYIATQIIGTVFTIIITVLGMSNALDPLVVWMDNNAIATVHLCLCASVVIYGALAAIFWLVTQKIMTKRLNLE